MSQVPSAQRVGRTMGVLLVLQVAPAPIVNFALLGSISAAPGGFLVNGAANAGRVIAAVTLGFGIMAATGGIAIAAWPVFRRHSQAMALWFLALSMLSMALMSMEFVGVMTMLSVSRQYLEAGSPADGFQELARTVSAARGWAHYTNLLCAGFVALVMYVTMFRFTLVPRALAAFGALGAVLEIAAVIPPFFGGRPLLQLMTPMGLSHLALVLLLIWRGFPESADRQPG